MESYSMNYFSGDSFDSNASFAISRAMDTHTPFYGMENPFLSAMSNVYSPFTGLNACLDSVVGGVPSTSSLSSGNTAPAWTGSFDGTVDLVMLSMNMTTYSAPSSTSISLSAASSEGMMEGISENNHTGPYDGEEELSTSTNPQTRVHSQATTWNGEKLRELGAALPLAQFPKTRSELGHYLLRSGTSVGRIFHKVHLYNKEVEIKRKKCTYTDHVYKCKARCTLGRDGWVETGQDCDVELGGWESYLRHVKQVHVKIKRENSDLRKWAMREKNKGTGRKRGPKKG